jgi:hypothetical protein
VQSMALTKKKTLTKHCSGQAAECGVTYQRIENGV